MLNSTYLTKKMQHFKETNLALELTIRLGKTRMPNPAKSRPTSIANNMIHTEITCNCEILFFSV